MFSPRTTVYENRQTGFSLIEVLVSLSIFTVVVTVSVGTLLVLIDANSKSQSMQLVMTNLTFALDSMTREIRTGDAYYCADSDSQLNDQRDKSGTRNCTAPDRKRFAFNEGGESLTAGMGSRRIQYRLEGASIERRLGTLGSWQPVTSPDVRVDELMFVVTGSEPGTSDRTTPTVTIYLSGQVEGKNNTGSSFNIQTTVAQIMLDI